MTTTLAVYSEAGGATKTTTAVSLAMVLADDGVDTVLVDLDPRAAATRWLGVEPGQEGIDVSAIIGNPDPDGWLDDVSVPSGEGWSERLRVVPSSRQLANSEAIPENGGHLRLRRAIEETAAEVVIIDCPNRQGGPLTQNALWAADAVVIAAKPDDDGLQGVEGAMTTLTHHAKAVRSLRVAEPVLRGIVVGAVTDTVVPRIERHTRELLAREYGELVLEPPIPARTIVREVRFSGEWYGRYPAGQVVVAAYQAVAAHVMKETR